MAAMFTERQIKGIVNSKIKSGERLSSGYRINRAADDAAGLSISEKMRAQIRGLDAGSKNIREGGQYCNVAEGALGEVHSMLDRIKELSVQAANDTNTEEDRKALDTEVQQLKEEINSVFRNTEYNTVKIWRAAYIPDVSGVSNDFGLYNIEDAGGSYYGGIIYMDHRYSWSDLGITNWDDTNHVFTTTDTFVVNANILHNNGYDMGDPSVHDDYASQGNKGAQFTIKTTKGGTGVGIEKSYDWKADNNGIYINNVMTNGMPHSNEGNTTWAAMGLTSGQYVPGGAYSFFYYGMQVEFDVPAEGADWTDFLDGINNSMLKIDWHSIYDRTRKSEAVQFQDNYSIQIDNSNKDYIAAGLDAYLLSADKNGIWMKNNSTAKEMLDKDNGSGSQVSLVRWEDLYNPEGYPITSWGIDEGGSADTDLNGVPVTDGGDTKVTLTDDAAYLYTGTPLGNSLVLAFKLLNEVSRGAAINDISGTSLSGGVVSPVSLKAYSSGSSSFVSNGVSANLSFFTQRDQLNRAYSNNFEDIATGTLNVNAAGNVQLLLQETGGGSGSYSLDSTQNFTDLVTGISTKIITTAKDLYYNSVTSGNPLNTSTKLGLGVYTFDFQNGSDKVSINMDLTNIAYSDVVQAGKTPYDTDFATKVGSFVQDGLAGFLGSSLLIAGNGQTEQKLNLHENSVLDNVAVNAPVIDGYEISLKIQAGANTNQSIDISYNYLRTGSLGIKTANVLTREEAEATLQNIDKAIGIVSEQRGVFGAYANRLEHAALVNDNTNERLQAAESYLRDADIAKEAVKNSKYTILLQAAQAILAQSNQAAQDVLQLLK